MRGLGSFNATGAFSPFQLFESFDGETSVNPHFGTHFFLIFDAYADTVDGLIRL
jgi:hypothetical protein